MAKHKGSFCSVLLKGFYSGCWVFLLFGAMFSTASETLDYPGAKLEKRVTGDVTSRTVYLSAPKRVSNELRFERLESVSTSLDARLLRLSDSSDIESVFEFYKRTFSELGEALFACEHRACGTSTNWANRIFEIAKLTGRDDNQFYVAGKVTLNGETTWVSAYIVRNGRRQNYVYLNIMPVGESEVVDSSVGESFFVQSAELKSTDRISTLKLGLDADPATILLIQVFTPLTDNYLDYAAKSRASLEGITSKFSELLDIETSRLKIIDAGPMPGANRSARTYYQFTILAP